MAFIAPPVLGERTWTIDRIAARSLLFVVHWVFDTDAIITYLNQRGAKVVISQHPRRSQPLDIDLEIYKWRHLIENFFCKLKEFKRIAMRSDKTDASFTAMIYAAAAVINSR